VPRCCLSASLYSLFKETCCIGQRASNQQQWSLISDILAHCADVAERGCRGSHTNGRSAGRPDSRALPPSTYPRATRARLFLLTDGCLAALRVGAVEIHSLGWKRAYSKKCFLEHAHAGVNGPDGSVELSSDCRCFKAQCETLAKLFVVSSRPRTTCWSRSSHAMPP
jgi:hypothetical protein